MIEPAHFPGKEIVQEIADAEDPAIPEEYLARLRRIEIDGKIVSGTVGTPQPRTPFECMRAKLHDAVDLIDSGQRPAEPMDGGLKVMVLLDALRRSEQGTVRSRSSPTPSIPDHSGSGPPRPGGPEPAHLRISNHQTCPGFSPGSQTEEGTWCTFRCCHRRVGTAGEPIRLPAGRPQRQRRRRAQDWIRGRRTTSPAR